MRRRGHPCGLPLLRRGQRGQEEPTRQEQATFGCLRWRVSRCRRERALARRRMRCSVPMPLGFGSGGCKGRSPLHKKTKNLPLPAGKSALRARGWGMGAGTKLKVGRAGDKAGKPPPGTAMAGESVPPGAPPSSEKSLDNPPEICYNARR